MIRFGILSIWTKVSHVYRYFTNMLTKNWRIVTHIVASKFIRAGFRTKYHEIPSKNALVYKDSGKKTKPNQKNRTSMSVSVWEWFTFNGKYVNIFEHWEMKWTFSSVSVFFLIHILYFFHIISWHTFAFHIFFLQFFSYREKKFYFWTTFWNWLDDCELHA